MSGTGLQRQFVKWSVLMGLCASCAWGQPTEDTTSVADPNRFFQIQVVDRQTNRGVPLVELRTVNNIRYDTDSRGIVAFYEPGLMNRQVFFFVESHGYAYPPDGFGSHGLRLTTQPGGSAIIQIDRQNIAERLYRVTGQGIYRDSLLTGRAVPLQQPLLNGQVVGQDSVLTCLYRGRIFWMWGDTGRPSYPLGNFEMSGAFSDLPSAGGLDPEVGVNLEYFVDERGFSRPMAPLAEPGVVWLDGLMAVPDRNGRTRMVARFARLQSLTEVSERGLMAFNDETQRYEAVLRPGLHCLPFNNTGHTFPVRVGDRDYDYFTSPSPLGVRLRVEATYEAAIDPNRYDVLTAMASPGRNDDTAFSFNSDDRPFHWVRFGDLLGRSAMSRAALIERLEREVTGFTVYDIETGKGVTPHNGSVFYNGFRGRWIAVFVQHGGGPSALGEVWYAEADSPTGPWGYARRVVTHREYSFYNPKQHPLFDRDGGRRIYFEGTYSHTFSGDPRHATPRYDYNQIMYALDLSDSRLRLPAPVYTLKDGTYLFAEGVNALGRWADVTSFSFFALAAEQADANEVAVFADRRDAAGNVFVRLTLDAPGPSARPLFYGLRRRDGGLENACVVALYEVRDRETGRFSYRTDSQEGRPLCFVWKVPERLMVLDRQATRPATQ